MTRSTNLERMDVLGAKITRSDLTNAHAVLCRSSSQETSETDSSSTAHFM